MFAGFSGRPLHSAFMPESARIIDGRAIAETIRSGVRERVAALSERGVEVRLDAVLVDSGDNGARVYAGNQARTCEALGIAYRLHELPAGTGEHDLATKLDALNHDPEVHAVMLHMPLPEGVDAYRMKSRIDPAKDVEGVNPANIGNVVYGRRSLAPCTALATVRLIEHTGVELRGKRVVVVGASDTVGKPIAVLLMRQDATVISCNIHTWGLADLCRTADVVVAAAGKPDLIVADMVKPGAVVIDVGVNRVTGADGKKVTVGDVGFEHVRRVAGWLSPVPGGVGPVTVASLLANVVTAAEAASEHAAAAAEQW